MNNKAEKELQTYMNNKAEKELQTIKLHKCQKRKQFTRRSGLSPCPKDSYVEQLVCLNFYYYFINAYYFFLKWF